MHRSTRHARRISLATLLVMMAACTDHTAPPKPTTLTLVAQPPASAQVGTAVAVSVVVKDEKGNAMSGQPLTITVAGGGTLSGQPSTTSAPSTSVGTWTLNQKVGANSLTIVSGSLTPVTISVTGVAGPPAKITSSASASFISTVGVQVPLTFKALDAFDNPVGQTAVQFAVTGGGSLTAPFALTDATGSAQATWTLGTTRGTNTLTATTGSAVKVTSVVAQADVPASMTVTQGAGQSAKAGVTLAVAPKVTVTDRFGNPTASQPVVFAVTSGTGTLGANGTVLADTNGVATGPSWTLGKRNTPQQLTISAGGVSQVVAASLATSFVVDVRFIGTMTDDQKAVFTGAGQRISAMITQGAGPVQAVNFDVNGNCGVTGVAPLSEIIPGIIIYASIAPIDGVNRILAQSGPCGFRGASQSFQPAVAAMTFDSADLATLANGGSLEDVATHEMMHAIGFGTLWSTFAMVSGTATTDPRYTKANGIANCRAIGGTTTCATTVPVENVGGAGTFGSHWRESVFTIELMTGFLNSGGFNPISAMSIGAMIDLGYQVSLTAADSYALPSAALRAGVAAPAFGDGWELLRGPGGAVESLVPAGGLLRLKPVP